MTHRDREVLTAWHANGRAWIDTIERNAIPSRVATTNRAIVQALLRHAPHNVLDVGCGEGWLVRELAARGIAATGIDAVPELIDYARAQGGGTFEVASYEDVVAGRFRPQAAFDAAVCNFSLLGDAVVGELLARLPAMLTRDGRLFVQTVHPDAVLDSVARSEESEKREGWREERWQSFDAPFPAPAPWYFRTVPGWLEVLSSAGFDMLELEEPRPSPQAPPQSLLLVCRAAG